MNPQRRNLLESGISKPAHQLFVLQWEELFSETALDTWQVRAGNILTLLNEIASVAETATSDFAPVQKAIPDLLDEALASIERDLVIQDQYPFVQGELERLRNLVPTSTEHSASDRGRLQAVGRLARVLVERIGRGYLPTIADRIRALLSDNGVKKENQLYLTMSLATELAARGFSVEQFRASLDWLYDGATPFEQRFDALIASFSSKKCKFTTFFVVEKWERSVEPERKGTKLLTVDEARSRISASPRTTEFFERIVSDDLLLQVEVEAVDLFSARHSAEALLTADFAAHAFATLKGPRLKLGGDALVLDDTSTVTLARADGSRRQPIPRSRDWHGRLSTLLRLDRLLSPEDAQHLRATLQYYRLAVTHPSDEVRLVNLWVAAENLVRRTGGDNILLRVVEHFAPLVALRNIRRVARGFGRRLVSRVHYRHLRQVGVLDLHSESIEPLQLMRTLKDPKKAPQLLELLDEDPLLRYRLSRFADKVLKNGESSAGYIEVNHRNVAWQLKRIYRARNAIVHRGEVLPNTRQLLQHLQTYVWTAMRHVTDELSAAEGRWTISHALEHWRTLYHHMVKVCRASKEAPLEQLAEPAKFLRLNIPVAEAASQRSPGKARSRQVEAAPTQGES